MCLPCIGTHGIIDLCFSAGPRMQCPLAGDISRKAGRPKRKQEQDLDLDYWLLTSRPNQYEWVPGESFLTCLVCKPASKFRVFRASCNYNVLQHEVRSKTHVRAAALHGREERHQPLSNLFPCRGWHPESNDPDLAPGAIYSAKEILVCMHAPHPSDKCHAHFLCMSSSSY
jgi:hypothetical protein